jgi:hypothetical protein
VTEPTPRQVLYALVSSGFMVGVAILVIGGAVAGLTPPSWTTTMAILLVGAALWMGMNWRRTGPILILGIGVFVMWAVGTLLVVS